MKYQAFFTLFMFCVLGACASGKKALTKDPLNPDEMLKMDQAFTFMQNKEYIKAAQIYDQLAGVLKKPSTKILMFFNAGVAYKEAGSCEKSLIRFRQLLDRSLKSLVFKARGLIEISYVYECLAQYDKAYLSLKAAQKVSSYLPKDVFFMVYPARLAIAYARRGKLDQATSYQSLALENVLKFKNQLSSQKELKKRMSRIFYIMGRSYEQKKVIQPEEFFKAFAYHQLFTLQSLFLKDKVFSPIAKKELALLLNKLEFALSKVEDPQKYKNLISAINSAQQLIDRENNKPWSEFYSQKTQNLLKILSQKKVK